ncbi:hypothetical protein Tco_1264334 [Tanacetum coccineum]
MSSITAQQTKLDLELVPKENRLDIGKCNGRIPRGLTPREPTFQVVLDAIALTPCYPAFLITADVPEVYMHQFWNSVYKHDTFYRFKIDKKKRFKLTLEVFRDIFQICPRVPGRDFDNLIQRPRPKSKNAKVRVNTKESAVKPEPELKNTVGCNLNPSDGPGKPNSIIMKTVKTKWALNQFTTAHLCAIDKDCEDFEGPILAQLQPISAIYPQPTPAKNPNHLSPLFQLQTTTLVHPPAHPHQFPLTHYPYTLSPGKFTQPEVNINGEIMRRQREGLGLLGKALYSHTASTTQQRKLRAAIKGREDQAEVFFYTMLHMF